MKIHFIAEKINCKYPENNKESAFSFPCSSILFVSFEACLSLNDELILVPSNRNPPALLQNTEKEKKDVTKPNK